MDFDFKSRILSRQWVYHQSLAQTHPDLFIKATQSLNKIKQPDQLERAYKIASNLAVYEQNKELALLREVFGVNLNFDIDNPDFYPELIKAINYALSTKEIFDRMVARIKAGETQISIAALISGYIGQQIKTIIQSTPNIIPSIMNLNKQGISFEEAVIQVISPLIDQAVELGIKDALKSADFTGKQEHGYEELVNYLSQKTGGVFIEEIKKELKIDELKTELGKFLKTSKNRNNDSIISKARKEIEHNKWIRGGNIAEKLGEYVINSITSTKSSNFKIEAAATGKYKTKPDSMIGIGININSLINYLDTQLNSSVSRGRNVEAFQRISDKLSDPKLNNGFIIYSNAKNYSLSKNFKGFSSGSPINLTTYEEIMSKSRFNNIKLIVGALANVIPGAIGDDKKDYLEEMLAVDFAHFMFDDFTTIGEQKTGARAIHVLYLDGIYVPLSYMLYELAQAIDKANKAPRSFINTSINAPGRLLLKPPNDTGYENWKKQREDAKNGITISVHFLSSFRSTIKSLFK